MDAHHWIECGVVGRELVGLEERVGLVSVNQRPAVHGVIHAAYLVLEHGQNISGAEINDVLKSVFVIIRLARNEPSLHQALVRTREVGEVNGYVVGINGRIREAKRHY